MLLSCPAVEGGTDVMDKWEKLSPLLSFSSVRKLVPMHLLKSGSHTQIISFSGPQGWVGEA